MATVSVEDVDEREVCEPCEEQGNKRFALHWCSDCPEFLCKSCYDHHKVQKATRMHKLLGIDEYRKMVEVADIDTKCKHHGENEIEFVCLTHSQPCCFVCKSELHGQECDMKPKEGILVESGLQEKLVHLIETINSLINEVEREDPLQRQSISQLEEQRNLFYQELRSGRDMVDQFLDRFQESVKRSYETMFASAQETIAEKIKFLETKKLNLVQRRETVQSVLESGIFSGLKVYLFNRQFLSITSSDQAQIQNMSVEAHIIKSKPVFEVNEKSKTITLIDDLGIKCTELTKDQEQIKTDGVNCGPPTFESEIEELAITSSTVEAEEELENPSSIDVADQDNVSSIDVSDKGIVSLIDVSDQHNASSTDVSGQNNMSSIDVSEQDNASSINVSVLSNQDNASQSAGSTEENYALIKHFVIERKHKDIEIRCARFLEENKIVMSEASKDRILVYHSDGRKINQLRLNDQPDEIAVLNSGKVAVACDEDLVLIDTNKMVVKRKRKFPSSIHGLGFANEQIFVCLKDRGMNVLDISGNIIRYIPSIRGNLYICVTVDGSIFSTKSKPKFIFSFSEENNARERYSCDSHLEVNGIACDQDNNVYLATQSPRVVKLDPTTKEFCTILSLADGLNKPYNVDYCKDSDQLLIIDEGKEIKIFQKRKKKM